MLSKNKEFSAIKDKYLAERASEAKKEGFIGKSKSEKLMKSLLNAED